MKIAIIGECMLELSESKSQYKISYGGDTLNTAVYLSRCGGKVDYFTVLGTDSFSKNMLLQWEAEGVGVEHVKLHSTKKTGLYIIENDPTGERFFHYWRDNSAAKTLISEYPDVFKVLSQYPVIYLTGITLSIFSSADHLQLFSFLRQYRIAGGKVIFDNNYRPNSWPDKAQAKLTFQRMMNETDIALLSFEDELALYGEHSIDDSINRWVSEGAKEVVIKNGAQGCWLYEAGDISHIPLGHICKPVDTTAAGDSFNGAFLAAKVAGKSTVACIRAGQACASVVIMYKGAIIDPSIALVKHNEVEQTDSNQPSVADNNTSKHVTDQTTGGHYA